MLKSSNRPHAARISRRGALRMGGLSLALPSLLPSRVCGATAAARPSAGFGQASSCIVLFSWGGMSHVDTWDPKPDAASNVRGEFRAIGTTVPGMQLGEHLPRLTKQADHLAIVRGVTHESLNHCAAGYQVLTGEMPRGACTRPEASKQSAPCLGSKVAAAMQSIGRSSDRLPPTATVPCRMSEHGAHCMQHAGLLGDRFAPQSISPQGEDECPGQGDSISNKRLDERRQLLATLESLQPRSFQTEVTDQFEAARKQAFRRMASPLGTITRLAEEPERLRRSYGSHLCGRSTLLARRLAEAGVPLVPVCCGTGQLTPAEGSHWDTHTDIFRRLQRDMLPPLDQASAALLQDLADRGTLSTTLIVWLTEFGRTPRINPRGGRDHYANCFSVAFAGGGIQGGQIFGRTDRHGSEVVDDACSPADIHATIFHALGIPSTSAMNSPDGKSVPWSCGRVLPLFG